ncbi:helix-turn-helix transcriptional regulator [Rhizobium sp. LjRoot254]|uniref:helix-turn-helix transcriptional regulator n=1 Tax=Rhizobium sp. LjRoot254 TaxID=3342297 RepID=UPI003ECD9C41
MTQATWFFRERLIARILARPEPLVMLEAPAGMGKSVLLRQIAEATGSVVHISHSPPTLGEGIALWDIPPYGNPAPLPESLFSGEGRIVVAKRPGVDLAGMTRAFAYGFGARIEAQELLLDEDEATAAFGAVGAPEILNRSGGWPLAAFNSGRITDMAEFIEHELLDHVSPEELVDLRHLMAGGKVPARQESLLLPFALPDAGQRLELNVRTWAADLEQAIHTSIGKRITTPAGAKAIAEAYAAHGRVVDAITTFQDAGFMDNAYQQFNRAGGLFFIYYHGPAAFDRVLAGFPSSYAHQSELLVLSLALQSCKRGDISRARRLLIDRFGDLADDLDAVFGPRSVFSREFREFRFLMLIYEDYRFTEETLTSLFSLAAEFPSDAHLFRGSLYNSVLEFYIRQRRFAEAEEAAQRAMNHYEAAKAPMLCFYISLHQAMIGLIKGDTLAARKHAGRAAKYLDEVPFETPNDVRLQMLLEACIEYEGGRAEPLARFLNTEIDDFSHGEIWPSLMEFTLLYGSQAMATHFSLLAARGFLDRWRVYQTSNRQFQTMVSIREAVILQNANRWTEAATRLKDMALPIDRASILADPARLEHLSDRDDIGLSLVWLRQILHEQPDLPSLEPMLTHALANLNITDRQRMGVGIWLAYVHKRNQDLTRARALLLRIFEDAARLGSIAPLAEEKVFLAELMDNKRISEFLSASSSARQVIRKLRDSGHLGTASGIRSELSRRENKILVMISEGAANKSIAGMLGVSEATVKFHLGNVYRKLGCRSRQEAISTARAAGIVG